MPVIRIDGVSVPVDFSSCGGRLTYRTRITVPETDLSVAVRIEMRTSRKFSLV